MAITFCYSIVFNICKVLALLLQNSHAWTESIQEVWDDFSNYYPVHKRNCSYPGVGFEANILISTGWRNSWDRYAWEEEKRTTIDHKWLDKTGTRAGASWLLNVTPKKVAPMGATFFSGSLLCRTNTFGKGFEQLITLNERNRLFRKTGGFLWVKLIWQAIFSTWYFLLAKPSFSSSLGSRWP